MAARNSLLKRTLASLAKEAKRKETSSPLGDLDGRRIVIGSQKN